MVTGDANSSVLELFLGGVLLTFLPITLGILLERYYRCSLFERSRQSLQRHSGSKLPAPNDTTPAQASGQALRKRRSSGGLLRRILDQADPGLLLSLLRKSNWRKTMRMWGVLLVIALLLGVFFRSSPGGSTSLSAEETSRRMSVVTGLFQNLGEWVASGFSHKAFSLDALVCMELLWSSFFSLLFFQVLREYVTVRSKGRLPNTYKLPDTASLVFGSVTRVYGLGFMLLYYGALAILVGFEVGFLAWYHPAFLGPIYLFGKLFYLGFLIPLIFLMLFSLYEIF
jgi:hypothetical protein